MFTDEDFDLDEDFLNDVSQKESQALSSHEESSTKKFKKDEDNSQPSCTKSISNLEKHIHAKSKENFLARNTNDIGGGKTIRTNLILERLKRNENTTSDQSIHQHVAKIECQSLNLEKSNLAEKSFLRPTNDKCRKTVILEVLGRNNVKSISARLRSPEEESCQTNLNIVPPEDRIVKNCETIRKSNCQSKPTSSHIKPITLVRQFPGPAGLLPHSSGGIIPPLIPELSCLDDSNDDTDTDVIDNTSMISKYCSQDTTNTFSEGTWQLLISDLSPDFLSGHEISMIKQNVLSNLYKGNKVPFLAGMVQQVDFSCLDPSVVLKDCTGTIKGTICKDILVEYPHSLDIGVVLFLGNVGLLTIGSYLKKIHVIITLKNIINVYKGKSKIFSVSEMDARLQNLNNCSHPCESVVNRVLSSSCSSNSNSDRTWGALRQPKI